MGDFDLQKKSKSPRNLQEMGIASDRNFPRDSHDFVFGDALAEAWISGWLRFKMSALSSLKDVMGISRQLYQSEYEMNHIEIYCVLVMSAKNLKQLEQYSLHKGTERNRENTELKLLKMFC